MFHRTPGGIKTMLDRFLSVASVLGTRHFGVILRVNVPAHADGQNHPEQLKHTQH